MIGRLQRDDSFVSQIENAPALAARAATCDVGRLHVAYSTLGMKTTNLLGLIHFSYMGETVPGFAREPSDRVESTASPYRFT
jgi:hypothetical protein